MTWPSGGSVLDEPAIAVAMFELIHEQLMEEQEAQRARGDS